MSGLDPAADPSTLVPDEAALGSTPRAKLANELLRALSRSARAFTLYDAKNVIMRRFLADYRAAVDAALASKEALTLSLEPFEFRLDAEVVYAEKDRERSLAFRLFRDGVRTVTLLPGLDWDEALRLLELVSLRFAGARQQEDDVVTLLRKAAFTHLTFTAVEGFVPSEEHPEPPPDDDLMAVRRGPLAVAPPDFDLPLTPAGAAGYAYREVPERFRAALVAEASPAGLRATAARLAAELIASANGPASELSNADLLPLLTELRDAFLADGAADAALELVRAVRAQRGIGSDLLVPVVTALGSPEHLGRLLDGVATNPDTAQATLVELLTEVGGSPVEVIAPRLGETEDPAFQRTLEGLLEALARRVPDLVLPHLQHLAPRVASRLSQVMMAARPEQGLAIATRLAQSPDVGTQLEAIGLLEHLPRSEPQQATLVRFLGSPDDALFCRAAAALGHLREARAFDALVREVEARAGADRLTRDSATAAGEALVACAARRALPLMREWAQPKTGLLSRLVQSSHERWLQCVAISGLGSVAGPEAEAEVRDLSNRASDEAVKRHCTATLLRRRRAAAGGLHRG